MNRFLPITIIACLCTGWFATAQESSSSPLPSTGSAPSEHSTQAPNAQPPNTIESRIRGIVDAGKLTQKKAVVSYLTQLDELRRGYVKRGDLDGVLAVNKEEKRVGEKGSVKRADVVADPTELRNVMIKFVKGLEAHQASQQQKVKTLVMQEREMLQRLVTSLTKANKIDQAVRAQKQLQQLDATIRDMLRKRNSPASDASDASNTARPLPLNRPVSKLGKGTDGGAKTIDGGIRVDPESGGLDLTLGLGAQASEEERRSKREKRDKKGFLR